MVRGLVAALLGAATLAVPTTVSAAPEGPPAWQSLGGDAVFRPPSFKRAFLPAAFQGNGFKLYDGDARYAGPMTIRLVDSPDVEDVRDAVDAAVVELTDILEMPITVDPDLTTATQPGPGEVLLVISETSPCTGDWAGCGGPVYGGTVDQLLVTGGQVWLRPDTTTYPPDEMQHLVDHELGHAFNLDHYSLTYQGEYQVMHPFLYDSSTYQAGDMAGLRHTAGLPPEIDADEPPYNDGFATAEALPYSGGTFNGTNVLATREDGEPAHDPSAGDSTVWYRLNSPVAGVVTMTTTDTLFDVVLAAYTGSEVEDVEDLEEVADGAQLDFAVEPFTDVWIAVAGVAAGVGPFTLSWSFLPHNDDFADADVLEGDLGFASGTTRGATREEDEPEHFPDTFGGSTWYRLTPASDSVLALNLAGSTFDTVVAVYTGDAVDDLEQVAFNDDEGGPNHLTTSFLQLEVEGGTPYSIAVANFGPNVEGDVSLAWALSPAGTWSRSIEPACPADETPAPPFSDVTGVGVHDRSIGCVAWYDVAVGRGGLFAPGETVTRGQMASFIARLVDASFSPLPDATESPFTDTADSVHAANIDRLAGVGIVTGRGNGRYAPDDLVTRAQMATFLIRAFEFVNGRPARPAVADHFTDDTDDTHEANINVAAQLGLTGGVAEGLFAPGQALRRDQMASFLARELALFVSEGSAIPPNVGG